MKLLMVSLGCDKNLVDTEYMLGIVASRGYEFTDCEEEADVIVVNTCCFIHDAKKESIDTILQMARYKEENLKVLAVCGCLAQRYAEEIKKEIPEVDIILGTSKYDRIFDAIETVIKEKSEEEIIGENPQENEDKSEGLARTDDVIGLHKSICDVSDLDELPKPSVNRIISTPGHYAYLKIAEGCDKCCTYCAIPAIRGHYRSYPMERLLEEARYLASEGVKELIVIAQETTVYGADLYKDKSLVKLLEKLCEIDGIRWIRLMYAYPEEIDEDLVRCMASNEKILHYIDMPIQHASDRILKLMGRRVTQDDIKKKVEMLRKAMPDICIRTTLITGFPTETQEDHEELYRFVNEMEFDRLGVFTYSKEENTPAAKLSGQIKDSVKQDRYNELMELQQAISFDKNEELIGKTFEVIVDGSIPEDGINVARTYKDAPDIDGFLFLNGNRIYDTGHMTYAKVIDTHEYDLEGVEVNEST